MHSGIPAMPQQHLVYNQQVLSGGMMQPVQIPSQQIPAGGMAQPVPSVNCQPTDTRNEKPPIYTN